MLRSYRSAKFLTWKFPVVDCKAVHANDNTAADLPDKKEENCGLPHSISQ